MGAENQHGQLQTSTEVQSHVPKDKDLVADAALVVVFVGAAAIVLDLIFGRKKKSNQTSQT